MKTSANNPWLPLVLAVAFVFYGLFFVENLPLNGPPDELAHVSYIHDAEQSGQWVPDYKSGKIVGSDELNYLAHPPLYYSIQALVGQLFQWDAGFDYKPFRVISLLMVAAGLLLILRTAQSLQLSDGVVAAMALGAVAIPNFTYIAASINNDNLVFLGVALLFASMVELHGEKNKSTTWAVAGVYLALLIIALTKVNAALFAIAFVFSWLLFTRAQWLGEFFKNRRWVGLLALALVVSVYYGWTYLTYGKLFPSPKYVYELRTPENPMLFREYISHFFIHLTTRFAGAYGHFSYLVYPGKWLYVLYFLLFAPVFLYLGSRIWLNSIFKAQVVYRLFDAMFIAAGVLLVTHIYLGYQGYLMTGLVAAIQPRYYLFLIPLIWLPILVLAKHQKFLVFFAGAFMLGALVLAPLSLSYTSSRVTGTIVGEPNNVHHETKSDAAPKYTSYLFLGEAKAGYIDHMEIKDGSIVLSGWSYDRRSGDVPRNIYLFRDNHQIARIGLNVARPDVARYFKSLKANGSGFRFKMPVIDGVDICSYDVLAEFDGELYSLLFDGGC